MVGSFYLAEVGVGTVQFQITLKTGGETTYAEGSRGSFISQNTSAVDKLRALDGALRKTLRVGCCREMSAVIGGQHGTRR